MVAAACPPMSTAHSPSPFLASMAWNWLSHPLANTTSPLTVGHPFDPPSMENSHTFSPFGFRQVTGIPWAATRMLSPWKLHPLTISPPVSGVYVHFTSPLAASTQWTFPETSPTYT